MLHKRLILLSLLFAGGVLCMADDFLHPRPMPRVLYPVNGGVLESGSFDVLVVAAENNDGSYDPPSIKIDGKDHPWQPYALPVCIAHVDVGPGEHFLSLASCEVMFYVTEPGTDPPKEWSVVKAHPGHEAWRNCGLCHETTRQNGQTVLGQHKGSEACAPCHSASSVAAAHNHAEAHLRDCASCHAVHGATLEHLLRAPQKQLCANCHR